jgi:16S rRNA (uracil1498-N3)-methyltransferase
MSAPRFHVAPAETALAAGIEIPLPDAVARHALQVLRLRAGDPLVLFDGHGGEYEATLLTAGRGARAAVARHVPVEREREVPIELEQSLVAADVMDDIVRRAVELGVAAITPVLAERSQRVPHERLARRVQRWRQIAIGACEQCGRNRVPPVGELTSLAEWARGRGSLSAVAVLDPLADAPLAPLHASSAVLVGPEGGFTSAEIHFLASAGARRARLGPAVLRADTAAIAALAVLGTRG